MNVKDIDRWLAIAGDSNSELISRIRAMDDVVRVANEGLQPRFRALWQRSRPTADVPMDDWDAAGAERVVDQHIVLALDRSGDPSLVSEMAKLVAQADRVLQGPLDELANAAKVVRGIGRQKPVDDLVALAATQAPRAGANAVRVLQMLGVTNPATGGPVPFPELSKPVSFTIHSLREEIETIASLSEGKIVLSNGAKAYLAGHDYDRGAVRRDGRTLASVLEEDLDMLGLAYAVVANGVVVCTFAEAGERWRQRIPPR